MKFSPCFEVLNLLNKKLWSQPTLHVKRKYASSHPFQSNHLYAITEVQRLIILMEFKPLTCYTTVAIYLTYIPHEGVKDSFCKKIRYLFTTKYIQWCYRNSIPIVWCVANMTYPIYLCELSPLIYSVITHIYHQLAIPFLWDMHTDTGVIEFPKIVGFRKLHGGMWLPRSMNFTW